MLFAQRVLRQQSQGYELAISLASRHERGDPRGKRRKRIGGEVIFATTD